MNLCVLLALLPDCGRRREVLWCQHVLLHLELVVVVAIKVDGTERREASNLLDVALGKDLGGDVSVVVQHLDEHAVADVGDYVEPVGRDFKQPNVLPALLYVDPTSLSLR